MLAAIVATENTKMESCHPLRPHMVLSQLSSIVGIVRRLSVPGRE